jgi:hypothetical protein
MTSVTIESEPKEPRPTWFKVKRKLPFLLKFGTPDDAVALAKLIDPSVSEEQQEYIIRLFLDAKHALGRSQ